MAKSLLIAILAPLWALGSVFFFLEKSSLFILALHFLYVSRLCSFSSLFLVTCDTCYYIFMKKKKKREGNYYHKAKNFIEVVCIVNRQEGRLQIAVYWKNVNCCCKLMREWSACSLQPSYVSIGFGFIYSHTPKGSQYAVEVGWGVIIYVSIKKLKLEEDFT